MNRRRYQNPDFEIGMKQKKSLGQVFLTSSAPLFPMLDQLRDWAVHSILEIGPGDGILTNELLKFDGSLTCVEKDHRFALMLKIKERENFFVEEEDILKFSFENWLARTKKNRAIVGNIPYNISTPILIKTLEFLPELSGIILMTQKEFGERLAAESDTSEYGSISVFTQLRSHVEVIADVPRAHFKPIPKVDSCLVSFTHRSHNFTEKQLDNAEKLTRHVFNQRRKKLSNSLRPFLGDRLLDECPIDMNLRPEVLVPEDFVKLAEFVFPE